MHRGEIIQSVILSNTKLTKGLILDNKNSSVAFARPKCETEWSSLVGSSTLAKRPQYRTALHFNPPKSKRNGLLIILTLII